MDTIFHFRFEMKRCKPNPATRNYSSSLHTLLGCGLSAYLSDKEYALMVFILRAISMKTCKSERYWIFKRAAIQRFCPTEKLTAAQCLNRLQTIKVRTNCQLRSGNPIILLDMKSLTIQPFSGTAQIDVSLQYLENRAPLCNVWITERDTGISKFVQYDKPSLGDVLYDLPTWVFPCSFVISWRDHTFRCHHKNPKITERRSVNYPMTLQKPGFTQDFEICTYQRQGEAAQTWNILSLIGKFSSQ
jgi:hypothetical protein